MPDSATCEGCGRDLEVNAEGEAAIRAQFRAMFPGVEILPLMRLCHECFERMRAMTRAMRN